MAKDKVRNTRKDNRNESPFQCTKVVYGTYKVLTIHVRRMGHEFRPTKHGNKGLRRELKEKEKGKTKIGSSIQ